MNRFFVHQDISKAHTIHKAIYSDLAIFEVLKEKVFAHSWQFTTDMDQVPKVGDIFPFVFMDDCIPEPLMITRHQNQQLYCLSNVCTHRGNLLTHEKCHSPNGITCKYHGRRFNLDGRFVFMPEFKEVENFPTESDHLPMLPLHFWGKWLFTSLGSKIDFFELIRPMAQRLDWLPLQDFIHKPNLDKDYFVNANWALYSENYLEGFHIPFVHEGLNAAIDYGSYETIIEGHTILQIGYSKNIDECFHLPPESIDFGKNIAAYYYWIYPNMMFNFYPWGLSINIVKPITTTTTKVTFIVYMWQEALYNIGAGCDLDKVEHEDEDIVQKVQQGVLSRLYTHGRYSVKREQGTHHFHMLLSQSLLNV
jgi:choline monooxygenase